MSDLSPGHWAAAGHFIGGEGWECVVQDEVTIAMSAVCVWKKEKKVNEQRDEKKDT